MDNRGNNYKDVSVEADIQQTAGPSDGLMGITCRDDNNGNFYSFEFSQNGTYGIYKYSNGSAIHFTKKLWIQIRVIRTT